jgi:hypothetical protein
MDDGVVVGAENVDNRPFISFFAQDFSSSVFSIAPDSVCVATPTDSRRG